MAVHVDARHGSLAHAYARTSIACDDAAKKFEEVWIVTNDQDTFAIRILFHKLLKSSEVAVGSKRRTDFDLRLVAQLRAHKLCGLQGALQRTRDNYIHLHLQRTEHASHQHALLFAFLD